MPCYHPLTGYRSLSVNASGKRSIVFNASQGFRDMPVSLPCNQCIGCRLERSRQWAIRCVHEKSLHEQNCFVTLTYSPENLPKGGSLVKEDVQKFLKRLRRKYEPKKIRTFYCGEYGENGDRPHYHLLLFGHDFSDKKILMNGENPLYRSAELEELWTLGHSSIGTVTFESAAYVARYVTKKVTGKRALDHYNEVDPKTGEILRERTPEFAQPSLKPGIGKSWFDNNYQATYNRDSVIVRGKEMKPPKYYNTQYEKAFPTQYEKIKTKRKLAGEKHAENNTRERLDVREECQMHKAKQLKRKLENGT